MKQTRSEYIIFERQGGYKSKIDFLLVPELLRSYSYNPLDYAKQVNELELVDLVEGELKVNSDRTKEARTKIIVRSPRVFAMNRSGSKYKPRLFVKGDGFEMLQYQEFEPGTIIRSQDKYDYVWEAKAAARYLDVSPNRFVGIVGRHNLGEYVATGFTNQRVKGQPKFRSDMNVYLLKELTKLLQRE